MDNVNLVQIDNAGGYGSEFDYDSELEARRTRRRDLDERRKNTRTKVPHAKAVVEEYNKEEGRVHRYHILSLDAYSRHKQLINDYKLYYGGMGEQFTRDTSRDKRDIDVIRENHKFLWEEDDDVEESWEKRLAKKYYDKLFKEYCITDLSRYKENKFAMRWRIDKEVVVGKGQFICGNKKCEEREGLRSWEVNFGYVEQEEKKNALVKLRLCAECSHKLNYYHKKREIKSSKRKRKLEESAEDGSAKKDKKDDTKSEEGDQGTSSEETPKEKAKADAAASTSQGDPTNPWDGPAVVLDDKSQEEEFDEYFEDMFL